MKTQQHDDYFSISGLDFLSPYLGFFRLFIFPLVAAALFFPGEVLAYKAYVLSLIGGGSGANGIIYVVDTDNNTVTATISTDINPNSLAIAPDGEKLYVTSGSSLTAIDTTSNTVVNTITSIIPEDLAFSRDGSNIYVMDGSNST